MHRYEEHLPRRMRPSLNSILSQHAEFGQFLAVITRIVIGQARKSEQEQDALQGSYRALMVVANPHNYLPDVQGKEGQGSRLNMPPVLNVLHGTLNAQVASQADKGLDASASILSQLHQTPDFSMVVLPLQTCVCCPSSMGSAGFHEL